MTGRAAGSAGGVLWALGVLCLPFAAEGLEVRVLSESALQLDAQAAGTTLTLNGSLRDDGGDGVPVQGLWVVIRREDETVTETELTTGYHGEFSYYQEFSPGRYQVEVGYPGGSYLRGSEAKAEVELETSGARLRAEGPRWVVGGAMEVLVRLQATSEGRGLPGYVTGIAGDRPFATVELDGRGQGEIDLGPHLRSGENTFRFRLDGSPYRQPVLRTVEIRRSPEVRISAEVDPVRRRFERGVQLNLSVTDESGPVKGAQVEVSLRGGNEVETTGNGLLETSDARGRVSRFIPFSDLDGEARQIVARVLPDAGEPVRWEGPTIRKEDSRVEWVVRILAWVALILAGIWWARRLMVSGVRWLKESWQRREAAWGSASRERREEEELFADVEHRPVERVGKACVSGPSGIRLEVWDSWQQRAPEGAQIQFADGKVSRFDRLGWLELEGEYSWARIEAPGYLPVETSLEGQNAGVYRISMTAVPLKIRELYRHLVRRVRDRDLWGTLTPRQIEELLRPMALDSGTYQGASLDWERLLDSWEELPEGERAGRLINAITDLVEESSFSGRTYSMETWETTRRGIEELLDLMTWSKPRGDDASN